MIPILIGLGLVLAGAVATCWSAKATSDMPMYIDAAVIAGGGMLTLVSIAMLLINT